LADIATSKTAPTSPPTPAIRTVGAPKTPLRDLYFTLLQIRWSAALGLLVGFYLGLNAIFAVFYMLAGGVSGARHCSFSDAFFFSVQTMGTIGYGAMYPIGTIANLLVVAESVTSLVVTAVVTGLLFAKFSRSSARIVFTREAVISPMEGVPTLMFRMSNERGNLIVEAQLRVSIVRTDITKEGHTFYRLLDLELTRDRSQAFTRSWLAMHPITPKSPLYGASPASLKEQEVELMVTITGLDETSMQPVHARHRYFDHEVLWGMRHADILTEEADGNLVLDMRKFHTTEATRPTEEFPYPAAP
jgi:inward rectifier potassium channel